MIDYFLFVLLIIFGILIIFMGDRLMSKKDKIKTLEKRISGEMTDFERLSFIVSLYKEVDFDNLREDHIKLWDEWVYRITR